MIEGGLRLQGVYKQKTDKFPLISYITVSLNSVETIEKCICSVIGQKNANIEYIIVDGGSTDGTLDVIRKYEQSIDYYFSEKDSGIYNAMNKGIQHAGGSLVCFMNSDDECLPGAAETITDYFTKYKSDMICGGRILKQKGVVQEELLFSRFPIRNCCFRYLQMFHQSTYARKELFQSVGLFDEKYSLLADWVWESRVIDAGANILFIDEKLSVFNNDGASFTYVAKREEEWINWIISKYPFLKKWKARFLLNCLDGNRHPFIQLPVIRRISKRYRDNKEFIKVIYDTALCLVWEALEELVYNCQTKNLDAKDMWKLFETKANTGYKSLGEVEGKLESLVSDSIKGELLENEYCFLDAVRKFEVETKILRMRKSQGMNGKTGVFMKLLKKAYLNFSYISGRYVLLSLLFTRISRNRVTLQLAHKKLSGNKWSQI